MSNNNDLIKFQTDGGLMQLTPMGLLQHFLPGAKLMQGSDRIYEGAIKKKRKNKAGHWEEYEARVYVNKEALIAMCMEAQEKRLNPISQIYLIPSNAPHKPAGHKPKYTAGTERSRQIPGFLGFNGGLKVLTEEETIYPDGRIVKRQVPQDRSGEIAYPGDTVIGFWAEAYIAGLQKTIRQEIPLRDYVDDQGDIDSFKGCKAALDELCRHKLGALGIMPPDVHPQQQEGNLLLTGQGEVEEAIDVAPSLPHLTAFITEPQRKRLFALCKEAGISYDTLKVYLQEEYNIDSNAKIPTDRYDVLCQQVTDGVVAAWRDAPSESEQQEEPANA